MSGSKVFVLVFIVLSLTLGMLPFGPMRPEPANAHSLCGHVVATIRRLDNRNVNISGNAWTTVCGTNTLASPDDGWFECWPVHRHHFGLSWWWHSHSSIVGAKNTGKQANVAWPAIIHRIPDSNGVKARCEFDGLHGNWWKVSDESEVSAP